MERQLWVAAALAVAAVQAGGVAEAQTITVQGQVQVDPYGQPQGQPQPPPGYGQTRAGPAYAPTYTPAYRPVARRVTYEDREAPITGLWVAGLITFGVSYGLTATFGSLTWNDDYATWSYVPLVGPWVALGHATDEAEVTGAVGAGVAQATGAILFVLGLSLRRTVRVARYSFGDHAAGAPQLALDLLPAPGGGQLGLTLTHW